MLLDRIELILQSSSMQQETKNHLLDQIEQILQDTTVHQETKDLLLNRIELILQNSSVQQETKELLMDKIDSILRYTWVHQETKDLLLNRIELILQSSSVQEETKNFLCNIIASILQSTSMHQEKKKLLLGRIELILQSSSVQQETKKLLLKIVQSSSPSSSVRLESCNKRNPFWKKHALDLGISVFAIIVVTLIRHLNQREADQHFELDTLWSKDTSVILCVLIMFNNRLKALIYFRLYGYSPPGKTYKYIVNYILRFSQPLFFIVYSAIILVMHLQIQNTDSLFSLYNSWMVEMIMVLGLLLAIFNVKNIATALLHLGRTTLRLFRIKD